MRKLKILLLGLMALVGVSLGYEQAKAKAKRLYPYRYYAVRYGTGWFWSSQPLPVPFFCSVFSGTSCTITTTVSPASIFLYKDTYLPGRSKSPEYPRNDVYSD